MNNTQLPKTILYYIIKYDIVIKKNIGSFMHHIYDAT